LKRIDLNVDIGEGFPYDSDLLTYATSANICAGEHAGSWDLTRQTIDHCLERGIRVGMHPGYPDRDSMGRGEEWKPEYEASLIEQMERFSAYCAPAYLKPHGSWYHRVFRREDTLATKWAREKGIPLMMLPKFRPPEGVKIIREGFADRRLLKDGSLAPRTHPGAVILDPISAGAQAVRVAPLVDSICLHGDGEDCLTFARLVRKALEAYRYTVGPE
jgi:5-oxoprolinase (ATP-hydrolysing) subunit A